MEFKFIHFLPENWLNALGTTLFHSLWLGVALAVLCAIVMFATRKTSAKVRYNLLTICLLLFVVAIAFTFYFALETQPAIAQIKPASEIGTDLSKIQAQQSIISDVRFNTYSVLNKLLSIWNSHAYQIVFIWFLIICGKSIQLLVGLNGIYHLRNNQTYAAGKKWDEHLETLSAKLGVNQQVKMMQSGIAKVPMVVGHLKPLILIPLGLLNGLSTAEVEAILSHELAHIKRRDYLVNLLQSFIEIVFFFNPAVLWVSQLIKTEREHCCDDLAIACVNDRKNYVKALIFCQEFKQSAPAYAMGITGKKGSLLHRASRMLFNTNSTLNKMEKTILTIALVSTVICTAAFKSVGNAATINKKAIASSIVAMQDTAKKVIKKEKEVAHKSAAQLESEIEQKIKLAEKKAAEKNKVITAKEKGQDQAEKQKAKEDLRYTEEAKKYAENEKKYKEAEKKYAADEAKYAKEQEKWAKEDAKWAEEDAKWAEEDKKWAAENSKGNRTPRAPRPPRPARARAAAVPPTPPTPYANPAKSAIPSTPPTPPARVGKTTSVIKTGVERVVTTKSVTNGKGHDDFNDINNELLKDGIIANTKELSYKLNKNDLIVNGVKQSQAIQKKYKEKYLTNEDHSLMYNFLIENQTTKSN
ncbi:hypothetical protein DU508_11090 [Pedobacter chinensis]|uniref:Peptidase M56 domain-containing protein n=1 Tax=Pedobacter chinensis TaxID=2282421 RepID=A0A369PYU8_9SPHI|nr:M56 family metallopeptidase [Pedobacter chinensis]RDC56157.1 hypothetical protein DU508_11090 [Pedobacter chinensis]